MRPIALRGILHGALVFGCWLIACPVSAMQFEQMQAIAGVALLDARVNAVIEAYGQPAFVEDAVGHTADDVEGLSATRDWRLVFTPAADHGGRPVRKDLNTQGFALNAFTQLVMHAQGGVGQFVVRRAPLKSTYEMPVDPRQSHRVVTVHAALRDAIPADEVIAAYGSQHERVTDAAGSEWLRYWVTRLQGQTPLRLYAVDFQLDGTGRTVIGLVANGPWIPFVKDELVARQKIWERNLYD